MINIGDYNLLIIDRLTDYGFFLVDKERTQEVLMPNRYMTDEMVIGDFVEVFVYLDSEDRIVATTEDPLITVGEFAYLQVIAESRFGAFLDWGLARDLMVPFSEMETPMVKGQSYVVYLYLDPASNRLVASSKIYRFVSEVKLGQFELNQAVEALVYEETEIGFKAIVDKKFRGMIYKNEIFDTDVKLGSNLKAFAKDLREDGKLDLILQMVGYEIIDSISEQILEKLSAAGGFMPYHDKSDSDDIRKAFGLSKKTFKKAVGKLYKDRKITIEDNGFRMVTEREN
jgi:hypothetical protein